MARPIMQMLAVTLLVAGCRREPTATTPEPATAETRTESATWGPINLAITFTPAVVSVDRDVLLTVAVTAPDRVDVVVPPLADRLSGFSISGEYADEPAAQDGQVTRKQHYRLTPTVADEYRLAPFAVAFTDARTQPSVPGWFPTPPVALELQSAFSGELGAKLAGVPEPIRIRAPFRTVAGYIGLMLLGIGILFALWRFTRRLREEVAVRRLSPRERALRELRQLLAKGLVERGLVKDFYVELTMVVRRYIERSHGVRAPEQTTEEFLAAVSQDGRFAPDVMARLRAFLQAADMVKFAAYLPGPDAIRQATTTAEAYVVSDSEASASAPRPVKEVG